MSEKMREALLRAVAMVESDVIQVRPSERDDLMQWLTQANAALAEQPAQGEAVEMSPEFTDTSRAALLWVLLHHQGGRSPVGQPLRFALGMGAHQRLTYRQIQEAKRWAALTNSTAAKFEAPPAPSVPDEIKYEGDTDWNDDFDQGYREGWNACRAAMLASAPEPRS